jgi:hypothetical protein
MGFVVIAPLNEVVSGVAQFSALVGNDAPDLVIREVTTWDFGCTVAHIGIDGLSVVNGGDQCSDQGHKFGVSGLSSFDEIVSEALAKRHDLGILARVGNGQRQVGWSTCGSPARPSARL